MSHDKVTIRVQHAKSMNLLSKGIHATIIFFKTIFVHLPMQKTTSIGRSNVTVPSAKE